MNVFTAKNVADNSVVYINAEQIVSANFTKKGLNVSLTNGQDFVLKMSERDFQIVMFSACGTHGELASGDFWYTKQ